MLVFSFDKIISVLNFWGAGSISDIKANKIMPKSNFMLAIDLLKVNVGLDQEGKKRKQF